MVARSIDDKRAAALELLDERTRILSDNFADFNREYRTDRAILAEIQGNLRRMEGEGLMAKVDKLDTRCFGDSQNSLDNRIRSQENWRWKVIGMGIAAGSVASVIVSLIMMLISKKL